MSGRMDKGYFEEKKAYALEALDDAIAQAVTARQLIESARYEMPNLTEPVQIHESIRAAQMSLSSSRRDFEKTRWADAPTSLSFDDWLRQHGHGDLVIG
ncbi:UNVERIFIED_ORG: hypothetical protein HNP28_003916 [Comamonas terrigena]